MKYLTKEQTKLIQSDIRQKGITLDALEADILDYLCSSVEREMEVEPSFQIAYAKVLQTLKPNELKMTQLKTQELLENKVSLLQKMVYASLFVLMLSVLGYMLFIPWTGELIAFSILLLIGLYIYSNFRWYFVSDGKSKRQKALILLGAFLVFLFILSVVFKLFHWPGAGYLMLGSLGLLIFLPVFMSIYFLYQGKSAEKQIVLDLIRKNRKTAEIILLTVLAVGFTARLLMIDLFGNMFIISSLFCFAFLFIAYSWPVYVSSINRIWLILLFAVSIVAYCLAIITGLFKIMNWPFPSINLTVNLPYLLISASSLVWYSVKIKNCRSVKSIALFVFSLVLFSYSLLLMIRISQFPNLQQSVYNFPVLVIFLAALLFFYKHLLFRVTAISLLGYYLLAFPYKQMRNRAIIETIYHDDQEFLRLYEGVIQNPEDKVSLEHLLEYNYNKLTSNVAVDK